MGGPQATQTQEGVTRTRLSTRYSQPVSPRKCHVLTCVAAARLRRDPILSLSFPHSLALAARSTWSAGCGCSGARRCCRRPVAWEFAVVHGSVADDLKVLRQPAHPALPEHGGRVAADERQLACLEQVPVVQPIRALMPLDRPLVLDRLPVVLAQRLQLSRQLEQAVRDRHELGLSNDRLELGVLDFDRRLHQDAWIFEPGSLGVTDEVVDVQGPRNALPPEDLVLLHVLRQAAIAVHIRKVKLSSGLERAVHFVDDRGLVWREVDHAVGDHEIHGLGLDSRVRKLLNVAFDEVEVRLLVSQRFGAEVVCVITCHLQLLGSHINASH
mmetsp:Transcript_32592/g.76786  ORF Transcript_32592/g.76786 Transcript_32592/m.76786 type:complete len:327 (+) Transcript_32592:86-1066(+)